MIVQTYLIFNFFIDECIFPLYLQGLNLWLYELLIYLIIFMFLYLHSIHGAV